MYQLVEGVVYNKSIIINNVDQLIEGVGYYNKK